MPSHPSALSAQLSMAGRFRRGKHTSRSSLVTILHAGPPLPLESLRPASIPTKRASNTCVCSLPCFAITLLGRSLDLERLVGQMCGDARETCIKKGSSCVFLMCTSMLVHARSPGRDKLPHRSPARHYRQHQASLWARRKDLPQCHRGASHPQE